MEEKGFRIVQCPECKCKLRLKITEKQYGKTLEVTCPKCKTKCRTKIPVPADLGEKAPAPKDPSVDSFKDLFGDLFKTSDKYKSN
jgi:uncharacterized protein YbaR (Trm112 family)